MDRGNTKREILEAALDLFSTQGYEATSVSQIAEIVGIRKASLYSHFASKQEILDSLIEDVLDRYKKHSVFVRSNRANPSFADESNVAKVVGDMITKQIEYILHDSYVSKARRMLTIEQYRNPQMSQLQTKQNYSDVMEFFTDFIRSLIEQRKLADKDAETMAAQFCLPITSWITLCDREPDRESEALSLIRRHIDCFFEIYKL